MKEITIEAKTDNIAAVTDLINEMLEEIGCPRGTKIQINVAIDEILSNIVHYAYPAGSGQITVNAGITDDPPEITMIFTDQGKPYNPLSAPTPDTTLKARQRKIGGLGIFLIKQTMDEINYEYKDENNHLTIRKRIH